MCSVKAVFFDLDDTLFDHSATTRLSLAALRDEHELLRRRSLQELEAEYARLLHAVYPQVLDGTLSVVAARAERLRGLVTFCGGAMSQDGTDALGARFRSLYQRARCPVPGAMDLLERLRGAATVVVVTNNFTEEQRDKLRFLALEGLIDELVTSEEVGEPKPSPAIFREALRRAGCRPEEAVMVGDSWEIDVLGAAGAGIRAVWLNREGGPCPDPGLAREIRGFEPVDETIRVILYPAVAASPSHGRSPDPA